MVNFPRSFSGSVENSVEFFGTNTDSIAHDFEKVCRTEDLMTIEDKLKDLILTRYKSIRAFTTSARIPYTTVDSILKRGVANSSVANVIKICKALNLSVDSLADGKLESKKP